MYLPYVNSYLVIVIISQLLIPVFTIFVLQIVFGDVMDFSVLDFSEILDITVCNFFKHLSKIQNGHHFGKI